MFNFFNLIGTIFVNSRNGENREYVFSLKHILFRVALFVFYATLTLFNHACMLLDEVFLFFYRFTRIKNPILIIGIPRTGTTLLFRTMADDRENFTCFTLMEILFAPSLIQKYLFYSLYRLDRLAGHPLKRTLLILEKKTVSSYARIHFLGYFKPEEDEFMLLHIYSTVMLKYFFPGSGVFDKYIEFDEKVTPREKRNILSFQKRCIKKHLFFWRTIHGKQKTFLCKNPIYSPKVNSVREYFPELRLIITTRDLGEVIPSFISMNAAVLKNLHRPKVSYPNAAIARDVIIFWERQLLEKTEVIDGNLKYDCHYKELIANLKNTVCEIYGHFGIPMSEAYLTCLAKNEQNQRLYRSDHRYDVEEINKAMRGS